MTPENNPQMTLLQPSKEKREKLLNSTYLLERGFEYQGPFCGKITRVLGEFGETMIKMVAMFWPY